ncbi:hypothetical protein A9Q81_09160 [Gammaproteobacteria bacterium 42_54_T18]|nr:hypothetical protein A9Q81_09160 [Gammaproteobacteria bacterium 42_54_T18]
MTKTSQVFARIDNIIMGSLPSMLSDNCQTRSYRHGILTLTTYSNAVATQLRYNSPNILSRLQKQPLLVDVVRIDIKVVAKTREGYEPSKRQRSLTKASRENCNILKDTADGVNSESLANSLRRLANTLENYGKD